MTEDSRGHEAYWHSSFFFSLFKYWTLDSFCVCLYQNTCALLFQIQRSLWHLYIPHWPHRSSWVSGMPRIGWGRTGVPSWPHLWVPPSAIPAVQLFGLLTEKRNINLSFNYFSSLRAFWISCSLPLTEAQRQQCGRSSSDKETKHLISLTAFPLRCVLSFHGKTFFLFLCHLSGVLIKL